MEITKGQKRLFIVLAAVIVYFIYDFITDYDTYAAVWGGGKKVAVAQAEDKQDKQVAEILKKNEKQYLEKWGRNPFYLKAEKKRVARVVQKKEAVKLELHAVSMKDNSSVALINDKIIKIGDMISGYTLIKIDKKQVTLSDGQKTITLKLDTY